MYLDRWARELWGIKVATIKLYLTSSRSYCVDIGLESAVVSDHTRL